MRRPARRFLFRLAIALGMTVAELGKRMTAAELREWMEFDARDPLPDRRSDWQFAALSSLTANLHAKRDFGGRFMADEFRLFADVWKPPVDAADRRAAVAQAVMKGVQAWNEGRRHER